MGGGVSNRVCLPYRHNGISCMPEEWSHGPQITIQGEAGIWYTRQMLTASWGESENACMHEG